MRSIRKRRAATAAERERVNARNEGRGGADSSGNSETTAVNGGTSTARSRALNRLLGNGRHPFQPAEYTASAGAGASPAHMNEVLEQRSEPQERRLGSELHRARNFEQPASRTADHASARRRRAPTPYRQTPSPNNPDRPVDVDLTADEPIEPPAIQSGSAREAVRSRHLDQREASLSRREQVLITRQLALVRQEEAVQAREEAAQTQEDRAFEKMMLLMRQREEVEEMGKRHRKEYERIVHRD